MSNTIAANGRLMKKTARHDTCSINHPPRTGPIAAVIAVKPDHVPIARPRSSSRKDALIIARLPGTRRAPPAPCIARAKINSRTLVAKPHHAEAREKIATPTMKMRRRP